MSAWSYVYLFSSYRENIRYKNAFEKAYYSNCILDNYYVKMINDEDGHCIEDEICKFIDEKNNKEAISLLEKGKSIQLTFKMSSIYFTLIISQCINKKYISLCWPLKTVLHSSNEEQQYFLLVINNIIISSEAKYVFFLDEPPGFFEERFFFIDDQPYINTLLNNGIYFKIQKVWVNIDKGGKLPIGINPKSEKELENGFVEYI